ncbi:MAG: CDP-glycerol glycerophosphotransferase family protein, partial [Bacilli bacterium]|nr:CDP-glycerol glycerophosphotransferase family protein [Bacilli bacterium]
KKHEGTQLYFATDNELVDEKHRVKPRSPKMLCLLQHAKIVIFESWVPLGIKKQPGSIWIQLFHGTPIKKMLFDSNEKEILSTNKNHKINKVKDMNRWTYLLADSDAGSKIFQRAFQFDKKRILTLGYPRVKYLKDNINNKKLIREIKKKYHIPYSKKVISYLPTWRDYNYNDGNDFNYLLDIDKLKEELGDKYLIIAKDHSYLSKHENTMDIETQELLLISDYLITDYSSVMFDAFAINLKTILYINDFKKYQASRGIYEEIWNDIKPLAVDSISKLKDKILNYKIDNTYKKIKEKYTYNNKYKIDIADIIIDYFDNKTSSGFVKSSLIITDETKNVLDSNR